MHFFSEKPLRGFLFFLLFTGFCSIGNAFAQEVQLTIGKRFESSKSTYINTGSVIFYEENPNTEYYPLGAVFRTPVKGRLEFSVGALYYRSGTYYGAFEKEFCSECPGPVTKITGVSHPTIEFPLLAIFKVFTYRKWELNAQAGISPAIRLNKKGIRQKANPPGFEPVLAEILNASPSTVKTAYINYRYGFQIRYGRIGAEAFWQQNLSRNLGKPLEVWGKSYPFAKRTGSFSVNLSYALFKWGKKTEE